MGKKLVSRFLAAALCLTILPVTAAASDRADALATLGLLQGTGSGYEEERELARGEGIVLVLQLLGLKTAAEEAGCESGFADGGWAYDYISFAYQKGIANGISETEFGTFLPMSGRQYSALLLRVLGYRDGEDFPYEDAAGTLSRLLDAPVRTDALTRGEAIDLMWLVLDMQTKDGGRLWEALAETGTFSPEDHAEAVRLTEPGGTPGSTTILFYIIASDLESLQGQASRDIEEWCAAPDSGHTKLVLQTGGTDSWQNEQLTDGAVQRSVIENGALSVLETVSGARMTDSGALADFIRWGAQQYPADRYLLVLWDHGFGALGGFGKDETGASMSLAALREGLLDGGTRFDLILFDACLMGSLETAFALRGCCDYLVASEELLPAAGVPYAPWLEALAADPGLDSLALAYLIATAYDFHRGAYLGGGTGMSVIAPVWARTVLDRWQELLARHTSAELLAAAGQCRELGLRDGGFDQFDLYELAARLGEQDPLLMFFTEKMVPFRKNGAALTGFAGLGAYLPFRHPAEAGQVTETLYACGMDVTYLDILDGLRTERTEQNAA